MKSAGVPTVFIIDDDRSMRQAIHDLVESVGLRAESFATGEEFLNTKHIGRPSCLVLDVRLPPMSGLDFQRRLTDIDLRIPIIFITAHGDIPMSVRALKSGAVERACRREADGSVHVFGGGGIPSGDCSGSVLFAGGAGN
jgi:FixJ family two-component response regulator